MLSVLNLAVLLFLQLVPWLVDVHVDAEGLQAPHTQKQSDLDG